MSDEILSIVELKRYFATRRGTVRAVDGVTLSIRRGETLALVGESGSGKSTVAHTVIGQYVPTAGDILLEGKSIAQLISKRPKAVKKKVQMVFQDPGSSLNPRRTVKQMLGLPLKLHHQSLVRQERERRMLDLLEVVELAPEYLTKVSSTLSGGEKARIGVARALATEPALVILDEPTSALDVSIQAKIINMLLRLQRDLTLSYLFITHDLSLMRNVATHAAIMYLGEVCEISQTEEFFRNPLHPYTKMLLSSVPVVSREEEAVKPSKGVLRGEIPSPVSLPSGCRFHTRCPEKGDRCSETACRLVEVKPGHSVRCHQFAWPTEPPDSSAAERSTEQ